MGHNAPRMLLEGKRGVVLNVVNGRSLGWAIAEAASAQGARVGVGAQNERTADTVAKLIEGNASYVPLQIDFSYDEQFEALREDIQAKLGTIDFVVHSAAYAPKEDLQGPFLDVSREGFRIAMDVSCYSLIKLCHTLLPILNEDGSVVTLSYLGSVRAVPGYGVMGVAKAALESAVRYLTVDLGSKGVRINALSPGPINTVAARGVRNLSSMIDLVHERAPLKRPFAQPEVASSAVYLLSDLSRGVTGQVLYIDNGYNILGL